MSTTALSYRLPEDPGSLGISYATPAGASLGLAYQADAATYEALRVRPRAAGTRLVLDGVDVTRRLLGPITWTRRRDSPIRQGRFDLAGTEFLPHHTRKTWTLTPLEIWGYVGPPAEEVERLLLSGWVITADSDPATRTVAVSFADRGGIHHQADACFEAAPLAGLDQGQILRQVAYSAGIPDADAPAGSRITKPVTTQGKTAFTVLSSLADAAGWWLRFDDKTGGLRAEDFRLKRPPQAPDEVWHLRELYTPPQVSPPQPLPSRWLMRFTSAVEVDELGIETETTKTIVESIYAPRVAVERQTGDLDAEGNPVTNPTGIDPRTPTLRVTQIICEITQRRGDLVIRRTVEEYGWHNPERARTRVGGSVPTFSAVDSCWVDDSGTGRWWYVEKFGLIRRIVETPEYDAAGSVLKHTRDLWEYSGVVAGFRRPGSEDPSLIGIGIGADGESYQDLDYTPDRPLTTGRISAFRHAERRQVEYQYAPAGHAERQVERIFRHFSPQASVDPIRDGHWAIASATLVISW